MSDATILWVEDYNRQQISLSLSEEAAGGFAEEMGFASTFKKKDDDVDEELFMPGSNGDPAPADVAPILYYSGHGTENGPLLNDGNVAQFSEMVFGKGPLSVAVFDCCRMLQQDRFGQWKKSFVRLHYLLGMRGDVPQAENRGRIFGGYLLGKPDRTKKTIPEAWRSACIETGSWRWSSLRALPEDGRSDDEFWPIEEVSTVLVSDRTDFVYRSESTPRPAIESAGQNIDRVRLLRTPRPDRTLENFKGLADLTKVGFQELVNRSGSKSQTIFGARGYVEVYEESNSLWATRRLRTDETLTSKGTGMSRGEILEETASFLQRLDHQGYRLSEPWEAFTFEIRENGDGSRSESRQTARHLDFRLFWKDLPVLGPGAQVRISAEDDVTELLRLARRPTEEGELPVISADEAYQILLSSREFKALRPKAFRIIRQCVGYYSLPPREQQDWLIPVYAFEGVCSTRALKDHHFIRYVQAIREEVRIHEFPEVSAFRTKPTVFP